MALIIEIKVVPSSGKSDWLIDKSGCLKWFLKSPPEKGEANKELIKALAKQLKVPQQDIEIIGGLTSRKKILKIHVSLTWADILKALEIDQQQVITF